MLKKLPVVMIFASLCGSTPGCGGASPRHGSPARDRCSSREQHPLDGAQLAGYLHDQVASERIHGLHRRWRLNRIAAAHDGGFLVAGGGSQLITGPDGCPETVRAMDIVSVDDDFEVRWRWRLPEHVSPSSIAATEDGGAVASFLTHGAAAIGQLQVADRAVGVLRLDPSGALSWATVVAMGYQRVPHYIGVEPAGGRIALGTQDIVEIQEGQGGETTRALRLHILSPEGEIEHTLTRRWDAVVGLTWVAQRRLFVIGDRRGGLDPELPLLPLPDPQQREQPPEPPRSVAVAELLDVDQGESLWVRQWGRASERWEARPARGPGGAIAFLDIFSRDPHVRGEPGGLVHRLVVIDAEDGAVRFTRLYDDSCGRLHVVGGHPDRPAFVTARPIECTGRDHGGVRLVVEGLSAEGRLEWSELLGAPIAERARGANIHTAAAAMARSGRTAIIGHARYMTLDATTFPTDFEHYALVLEP